MTERASEAARKKLSIIGGRYKQFEGTEYIIDRVEFDTTGYEETGNLTGWVYYTQVVAGDFPVGTKYKRKLDNFFGKTIHEGQEVNIFEPVGDTHSG